MVFRNRDRLGKESNQVGIVLKAARNYFYYSPRHESFIRIRHLDEKREFFEVESCPPSEIVVRADARKDQNKKKLAYLVLGLDQKTMRKVFQSLPFSKYDTELCQTWTLQLVNDKLQIVEGYQQQH